VNESAWTSPGGPGRYGGRPGTNQAAAAADDTGHPARRGPRPRWRSSSSSSTAGSSSPPAARRRRTDAAADSAPARPRPRLRRQAPHRRRRLSRPPWRGQRRISACRTRCCIAVGERVARHPQQQQTATGPPASPALAGQVNSNGQRFNWYGEACSGPLPQHTATTASPTWSRPPMNLPRDRRPLYGALATPHSWRHAVSVSGHPGWEIKYLRTYPDAAGQGPGVEQRGRRDRAGRPGQRASAVGVPRLGSQQPNVAPWMPCRVLTLTLPSSRQPADYHQPAAQRRRRGGGNGGAAGVPRPRGTPPQPAKLRKFGLAVDHTAKPKRSSCYELTGSPVDSSMAGLASER